MLGYDRVFRLLGYRVVNQLWMRGLQRSGGVDGERGLQIHTHINSHARTHSAHTRIHTHTVHTHAYTHAHTRTHTHTHTHTHIHSAVHYRRIFQQKGNSTDFNASTTTLSSLVAH